MKTKLIEATSNKVNWGKFVLARFEHAEWMQKSSVVPTQLLIAGRGWEPRHIWVLDLATGEGAFFMPRGVASEDLKKRIWVCPLFEPFLDWLYTQDLTDLDMLPSVIDLPDAPNAMQGYRREGPEVP